ncbi:MAG: hypothetical protein O3A53_02615 [Acidobacteria bacterium]|nr:hypothetical protein [Acidobacteriota bacterium]
MKRRIRQLLAAAAVLVVLAPLAWVQNADVESLSRYLPAGPVVALEAQDFQSLLAAWNASPEKAAWLASDNYSAFTRSKLFLRLQEAQTELAAATGFPIDLTQVQSIAGGASVLGVYDIGELRLLYITRLDASAALESALLRSRLDLEPRQAGGVDYWVRADDESGRSIAFGVVDGLLFVATDDTLLGRALELRAGQGGDALPDETWYPTHGPSGDLRLIENLSVLVRSPHFRSYWIQGNVSELSAYSSATSDLFMEVAGIREERRLVRREAGEPAGSVDVAALTELVPDDAAFFQAWEKPTAPDAVALLSQKLLDPASGEYVPRYRLAPGAASLDGRAVGDLETRIDAPPAASSRSTLDAGPLLAVLGSANLQALLQVQTSSLEAGLARYPSLVGVRAESPWDEAQVLSALQSSVAGYWMASNRGVSWRAVGDYYELPGLRPLFAAVRGDLFLASDSEHLISSALERAAPSASGSPTIYRAGFRHDREADNYAAAMAHLDFLEGRNPLQTPRQPSLFADNIGSLSRTLSRVGTVDIPRRDSGTYFEETVLYRMR